MAAFRSATPGQAAFLEELTGAGLLIPSGVPGIYGRSAAFEAVRTGLDDLITRASAGEAAEPLRFPPVVPRRHIEDVGYLRSFPHLAGSVFAFEGSEAQAGALQEAAERHQDWSGFLRQSELVLTPAVCYAVYPAIAARGPLPPGGVTVDPGGSYAFRHEPSGDPARLQMFHMRELVRLGEPDTVTAWRDAWRDGALTLLTGLGLDAGFDVAADPFFGRRGRLLAASQREQELKFEILAPIAGEEPTAIASFNYHQDHFSSVFGLTMAGGGVAHTACLGFGLERVTLALLRRHGLNPGAWPGDVREQLWPS